MKHKLILILFPLFLIIPAICLLKTSDKSQDLRSISSESELYDVYLGHASALDSPWFRLLTLPFSVGPLDWDPLYYNYRDYATIEEYDDPRSIVDDMVSRGIDATGLNGDSSVPKDYSTTNLQVEDVDEADIFKTDGNYVYSISGTDVLITDVSDHSTPHVVSLIPGDLTATPEEIILSDNSLTIIYSEMSSSSVPRSRSFRSLQNTTVSVYDIQDRATPKLTKSLTIPQDYKTSRRIDNRIYIFSSGYLQPASEDKISRAYLEDNTEKEFPLKDIKYLPNLKTNAISIVTSLDLANPETDAIVRPFLLDFEDAYVSTNSIYLTDYRYNSCSEPNVGEHLKRLFGFWGVFGLFLNEDDDCSSRQETAFYKFKIEPSGEISYVASTSLLGEIISRYSLDEQDDHLRVALYNRGSFAWPFSNNTENGTYIAILDEKLNLLGKTEYFGRNEDMRASRFVGDKVYVVTYYNTDPLFVIDLADEKNPKILGELKIPGYSTYLHPYDETHIFGIGVDTQEDVIRDSATGSVIRTTARVTGLKIALFDVSDLNNPKQMSVFHFGDSVTTSAILSNPKALLFSKEKSLLAIPVNNFSEELNLILDDVADSSEIESVFSGLSNRSISEGYLVLNIDLKNGLSQKGIITHDAAHLLRGAYIENDIMTVSDRFIKFHQLSDLSPLSSLSLGTSTNLLKNNN